MLKRMYNLATLLLSIIREKCSSGVRIGGHLATVFGRVAGLGISWNIMFHGNSACFLGQNG